MRECRFHREIYDGKAVDAAVKVLERFGRFDLAEEPEHWIVRITAQSGETVWRIEENVE